jgi:drug/metabolite transporter (DMT)-like permease
MPTRSSTTKGVCLILLWAILVSTAGLFTRLITVDAWTLLFWRGLFGGGFIAAWITWQHRGHIGSALRAIGYAGIVAAACSTLATICFINALRMTSVADVMVIGASAPFVTAGLAWAMTGMRESRATLLASTVALAGILLTFHAAFTAGQFAGDLLALAMTILISTTMVIIRIRRDVSMQPAMALSAFGCAIAVFPLINPIANAPMNFVYLLLFGMIQFGLGMMLLAFGTRLISATRSALIGLLEVPLAALWVWLAFGEMPGLMTCIGGSIIMVAVFGHVLLDKPAQVSGA